MRWIEFDLASDADDAVVRQIRTLRGNVRGPSEPTRTAHRRGRLRPRLSTVTTRMMSERAVRASEAAAAAASASAQAAQAVADGRAEARERGHRSAFHWGFFGGSAC